MKLPLTKQDFVNKVNNIHNNKYDYSKTVYINSRTKIIIICPTHGEFEQLPNNHYKGSGCPKCKADLTSKICKYSNEKFINLASKVHNNRFEYINTEYKKANEKVIITCPRHGDFEQTPANHLQGQRCPKCSIEDKIKLQTLNIKNFIDRSNKVHNNKYDYSKTVYKHGKLKSIITCPRHGDFEQTPNNHLNGAGCPNCKASKGELAIIEILDKHNIKYIREHKIPEVCNEFYYDFYLPDYNLLIEFHGKQHYEYIPFFHDGQYTFEDQKVRDDCIRHNAFIYKYNYLEFNYKHLKELSKDQFEDYLIKRLRDKKC